MPSVVSRGWTSPSQERARSGRCLCGRMLSSAVARIQSVTESVWSGPGDLSRPLRLEWRLVLGRWLAILFVAAGLRLYQLPSTELLAAYGVLFGAFLYS